MATTKRKTKPTANAKANRKQTGALRVRRDQSERRTAVDEQFSGVRREIGDAVQAGEQIRRGIESRIEEALHTPSRPKSASRRRTA